jgi:hypothetical protein
MVFFAVLFPGLLLCLQLSVSTVSATYTLKEDFQVGTDAFFDRFNFFTKDDPTHGFVNVSNLAWIQK